MYFRACPFCGFIPKVSTTSVTMPLFKNGGIRTVEREEVHVRCENDDCATQPSVVCYTESGANMIWNGLIDSDDG